MKYQLMNPRERGRRAAGFRWSFSANPFPLGSYRSREWSKGWREVWGQLDRHMPHVPPRERRINLRAIERELGITA